MIHQDQFLAAQVGRYFPIQNNIYRGVSNDIMLIAFHIGLKTSNYVSSNYVKKTKATELFARSHWFFEIVRNLDQFNG